MVVVQDQHLSMVDSNTEKQRLWVLLGGSEKKVTSTARKDTDDGGVNDSREE